MSRCCRGWLLSSSCRWVFAQHGNNLLICCHLRHQLTQVLQTLVSPPFTYCDETLFFSLLSLLPHLSSGRIILNIYISLSELWDFQIIWYSKWCELLNCQGFFWLLWTIFVSLWLNQWYPHGVDFISPPVWGILSLAAMAGVLTAYPIHKWMISRGFVQERVPLSKDEDSCYFVLLYSLKDSKNTSETVPLFFS